MTINELIDLLTKLKNITNGETKIYIRNYDEFTVQVFGILPGKNDAGEDVLIIE